MRVYAAEVYDITENEIDKLWTFLDKDRQEKVLAFKNAGERNRSIFAGLLLRHAFMQAGHSVTQWQQVRVERGTYGKPYIKGFMDFQYSLSHSGKWILCAVDTDSVGADVQEGKPWKLSLAKRFFHPSEYDRLLSLEGMDNQYKRTQEFYKMWTAKESVVKLIGRGIGAGIGSYVTNEDYSYIYDIEHNANIRIRLYNELKGYTACVCSRAGVFPERLEITDVCGT